MSWVSQLQERIYRVGPIADACVPVVMWSHRLFPETRIVRFNRRQDRFLFFSMLNELVGPDDVILDFGAGRNRYAEFGRHLEQVSTFRGRCARVIGVDVDPAVRMNDSLDEAHTVAPDGVLPMSDGSVDIVYSYAVLEHLADPPGVAAEIDRVLKPGGWFCAWTPNKWGYIGIGARAVPNRLHARLLERAQPGGRSERDIFPTVYKMNTLSIIDQLFPPTHFDNFSFIYNAQPAYNFGRGFVARLWLVYMALMPRSLGQSLMVFVRKR